MENDRTDMAMLARKLIIKQTMSFHAPACKEANDRSGSSITGKIGFEHFKLKLFSWCFKLLKILLILYN